MRPQPLVSIPVAAVLARRQISRSGWSLVHWEGVAVLAGERFAAGTSRGVPLRDGGQGQDGQGGQDGRYLWDGLRLELHRDAAETYWFNLTGARPSLFIICSEEPGDALLPVAVTADHDESVSATEADYKVFAVPIPAEVLARIEEFVMTYFKPEPKRKRKRENWSGEGQQ